MASVSSAKKKIGRPSRDTEAVNVRIDRPMLVRLDAWMIGQDEPCPSRPEAIRRILIKELGSEDGAENTGGGG